MKSFHIFLSIFSLVIVFAGCNDQDNNNKIKQGPSINDIWANTTSIDSVDVKVFGKEGNLEPEIIVSKLPKKKKITPDHVIYPGVSFLRQNLDQKLAGEPERKSIPPKNAPFLEDNVKAYNINNYDCDILKILDPLTIDLKDIDNFRTIAINQGKYNIVNGDTILPPMKFIPGKPKLIMAGKPSYKYDALTNISNINRDQDLPNSFIRKIFMTDNDIVWLATAGGGFMNYDGQFFQQYTSEHGLPDDDVYALIMDSKGKIWAGTHNGGLICYDGKFMTVFSEDQGLRSKMILSIFEDSDGIIWAGTYKGLLKIEDNIFSYFPVDKITKGAIILNIIEDSYGNKWFASRLNGLFKLNDKIISHITKSCGLPSNRTLSVFEDGNKDIWFSTNGSGICKLTGNEFTYYGQEQGVGNDLVLCFDEDDSGNIWMATNGNGVTSFDGKSFRSYTDEDGLFDNYIRTLYIDDYNDIWIGTDGVGISVLKPGRFIQLNKRHGLTNDLVTSIYQDNKNRVWLGTFDGGVIVYELPNSPDAPHTMLNISIKEGLNDSLIVSIDQDKDGNYLIGTFRGGFSKIDYNSFENGELKVTNYTSDNGLNSNNVNKVFTDSNGKVWVGTRLGPNILTDTGFISFYINNELNNSEIVEIFEDEDHAIWMGSYGSGLYKLNNDSIGHFNIHTGLADNAVWVIKQPESGLVLLGTDMGMQFIKNDKSLIINTDQGLSNNEVYSIIQVSDVEYWVGTTLGLNQVVLTSKQDHLREASSIVYYDKYDGLISDDFYHNSAIYDDGWLWFGTLKGLIRFNPNVFTNRNVSPIVHLKDILINGVNYDFSNENDIIRFFNKTGIKFDSVEHFSNLPIGLKLPYDQNHITIFFSGTDWNTPSKVPVEYKLEGVDKGWLKANARNQVDYRNLSFGNYTFRLKSVNLLGIESDEVVYKFKVLPPWYYSWWSISLYILSFLLLIYLIVKIRVSAIQKQKVILERTVSERTKDLDIALVRANEATDAKSKFIATISHELRTPLNAITGLSHLALKSTIDKKLEDYLLKIDSSARTLLSLINEILDFSKIESGKMNLERRAFDLDNLLNLVIELNAQAAQNKGLEFIVDVDKEVPNMLIGDSLRINQIITNLCNNAIKFTSKGEIILKIEKEEEINKNEIFLHISVSDTGIGVSDEQKEKLFESFQQADTSITRKYGGTGLGLSIARLFIEMMEGEIWLDSELGKGSVFHLNIKVGVNDDDSFALARQVENNLSEFIFLILMENQKSRKVLTNIFVSYSLNYKVAENTDNAKALIQEYPFDLLVIDNDLKDMSGIDFIMNIQKSGNSLNLKSLLVSDIGSNLQGLEQNISSIHGTLTKPFLSSTLFNKIYQILEIYVSNDNAQEDELLHLNTLKQKLSGKKVLIAEDNELNSQVLFELLSALGINTDRAIDGGEAITKVINNKYDLILMDLHMPVIDGYMSSQEIRDKGITTPIIAVTADLMESVSNRCKQVGINDILSKPIDPDYLYGRLEFWLTGENSKRQQTIQPALNNLINLSDGIARLGGNHDLYLKMLSKFHKSMFKTVDEAKTYFSSKDYKKAFLIIHSFKGESGNLGIYAISKLAEEIEPPIEQKDKIIFYEKIDQLYQKLLILKQEIEIVEQSNSQAEVTEFRPVEVILQDLITGLESNSPEIFNLIDELEEKEQEIEYIINLKSLINESKNHEAIALIRKIIIEK